MKKITLIMSLFLAGLVVQAQDTEVVLSQNTDEFILGGGITCPGGDNWWFRSYDLTEEGVTEDVKVVGTEFVITTMDFGEEFEIYAFDYAGFPSGFDILNPPAPIASGTFEFDASDIGIKMRVDFDEPAQVTAGSNIVIAIVQPFMSGNTVYLGITAGEFKPSFFASENCEFTEPTKVGDLNPTDPAFEEARQLINLVVDTALSTSDFLAGNVAVYPNPTTDVFNVQLPSNVVVNSSSLVDVLGKTTGVVYNNGEMNVSALARGVYFLNLNTNVGTYTQKVVKQ